MRRIRILIVDDHALLRQGLRQVLELEPDLEVVGEAQDGFEAVAKARELAPDVVLMDINMPGLNGIEATRRVRREMPDVRVLVLTIHDDDEYLREAAQAGVSGYVLKDVEPRELVRAVRLSAAGRPYLHPDMGGRLLSSLLARPPAEAPPAAGAPPAVGVPPAIDAPPGGEGGATRDSELTRRECEVLELLADGASNRDIAARLFISEKTVKNHVTHILQKLGLGDRVHAALWVVRSGWAARDGARPR